MFNNNVIIYYHFLKNILETKFVWLDRIKVIESIVTMFLFLIIYFEDFWLKFSRDELSKNDHFNFFFFLTIPYLLSFFKRNPYNSSSKIT